MAQTAPNVGLPPIGDVRNLADEQLHHVLDVLFEPSPHLRQLAQQRLRVSALSSYDDLIEAVGQLLSELQRADAPTQLEQLDSILAAHPRLGAKKVDSAQSATEQAHLRDHAGALELLNAEYEAAFPGLRYVVFVKRIGGREAIFQDVRNRISRADIDAERRDAIQAMCDIARDRVAGLT